MILSNRSNSIGLAKTLLGVAWPLMLNNLFNIGVNAADTLMAGHLGSTELAAVALGSSIWITLFLGGLGIVMSVGPTVAQHFGAGRIAEIGTDTRQGFWLALFVAIPVIIAMHHVSPIMLAYGIEEQVVILAQGYLNAMSWGVIGCYWYHCLRQMNEGLGRTVPIMLVMGTSLPINIGLNYVFMYGKLGSPALGAVGAGLGSGITFWLMFIFIALYTRQSSAYHRFNIWHSFSRPQWPILLHLAQIGGPIGISFMLQAGLFTAVAFMMGGLGTSVVAAHAITLNFASLVFMLPLGLGMAATSLVGQAIGRGEPLLAKRVGTVAFSMSGILMVVSACVTASYANAIAKIYTIDGVVINLATSYLLVAAILQLGDGTQATAAGALRGAKDTTAPMIFNAFAYWVIGFTAAYVLGIKYNLGGVGVWIALTISIWLAAMFMIGRFYWVLNRQIRELPTG